MDPELIPEVEALFASRPADEWRLLENAECCLSVVSTPEEVVRDPQIEALSLILSGPGGAARLAPPVTLRGTSARPALHAPSRVGEHTDEVLLRHLGLTADQVRSLRSRGAVF